MWGEGSGSGPVPGSESPPAADGVGGTRSRAPLRAAASRSGRAVTCEECRGEGAGDSRYSSRPTLTSALRIDAPAPAPRPLPRRRPLLPRQLLERGPGQVHGLRLVPRAAAQRLLPGLCHRTSRSLQFTLAHPGGRPQPGPGAGPAFWLPGLETVSQEREVYHPHRGDRWRGLSRCGLDPVIELPALCHSSFIHFGVGLGHLDTACQLQALPATGGGVGVMNHLPALWSLLKCLIALSGSGAEKEPHAGSYRDSAVLAQGGGGVGRSPAALEPQGLADLKG